MTPWDPTAPIAPGVTLLEASAGTGKTFGITSLVLRLVAETGLSIDRILVVTYTRAATAELETRVRRRLQQALDHLENREVDDPDPVLVSLVAAEAEVRGRSIQRLRTAIAGFDRAVITTIHGFCQQMLQRNAFESGVPFDLELVPDPDALVFELVDDFLVRCFYDASPEEMGFLRESCQFTRDGLRVLARRALADPDAVIVPDPSIETADPRTRAAARRAAFATALREAFETRKSARRVQTYQDLLTRLARGLGPDAEPSARAALMRAIGQTFDAALIDEFQDTDALQWRIFDACFGQGQHHLWLIGDPKQAIYGFRGANVQVYAAAARAAGSRRYTLATNWRSDPALVAALNGLLDQPAAFGPAAPFGYHRVHASPNHPTDRLRGSEAPLRIRWIDPSLVGADDKKPMAKGAVSAALPARVAADIAALLAGDERLAHGADWRSVHAGDIAVLVRTGAQANHVHAALGALGIPAVLTGSANVLASDEALAVQQWLAALAASGSGAASRVAASSFLFGWTSHDLVALEAGEPAALAAWEGWLGDLARWRQRFLSEGFTAAFGAALDDSQVLPRLLGAADGERRATNLLHVAELLDTAEREARLGLGALADWLARRRADEDLDTEDIELRLDREDRAVRILTIHRAKGLEFPITFVPFLWDGLLLRPSDAGALWVADLQDPTRRILDVTPGSKSQPSAARPQAEREAQEEGLRLAYVALTRAQTCCVVYAGHIRDYATSPLAAIFHGSGPNRLASAAGRVRLGAAALREDLHAVARRVPGLSVTVAGPAPPPPRTRIPERERVLAVRRFSRGPLDHTWRRHSYTSMMRAAGSAAEVPDREGFDADAMADSAPVPRAPASAEVPLASFPAGAEAGTLLHAILERVDFSDLAALPAVVVERLLAHGFEPRWTDTLVTGLGAALRTPLGGPLPAFTLGDLPRQARLDELRFDLPLRGAEPIRGAAIAAALQGPSLPAAWLASLERLEPLRIAGFLTGSIDLVFRAPGATRRAWYVVDYKSNRLVTPAGCVPEAFGAESMQRELARHDYYLQYHLYLVALHRYLKWRLGASYAYDRDIGGVYYLFLRGMLGEQADRAAGSGCFFDRPPREAIEALDAALGGR